MELVLTFFFETATSKGVKDMVVGSNWVLKGRDMIWCVTWMEQRQGPGKWRTCITVFSGDESSDWLGSVGG